MSYISCIVGVVLVVGDNNCWLNEGYEYLFDTMDLFVLTTA